MGLCWLCAEAASPSIGEVALDHYQALACSKSSWQRLHDAHANSGLNDALALFYTICMQWCTAAIYVSRLLGETGEQA